MAENNEFIAKQIANGVYSLSRRRKGKSFMWNVLAEVLKEDGSVVEGLVYCRTCRKLLKFVANQTSNLCRHKCCEVLRQPPVLKTVTPADKQEAISTCTEWIIEDCRPISSISGSGFMKIVKFFIKIGAVYGEYVDVSDLVPDPTTISDKLQEAAEIRREIISKEIKDVVNNGGATATINMWSDNYVQRNLLGVTLHYQKDFKLFDIILGLKSMDFEKSTGEYILNKLKTLFNQFGIQDIAPIKFVTDKGRNIVKALENNTRLNCSSHLFANALDKSFEETTELTRTLQTCQNIVKYFKKANLQHMLPVPQNDPCPTRWNSNYAMLKSIVDNWYNVNEVLTYSEDTKHLLDIKISTLNAIVELCKDFEIVFKKMQACNTPSLCFALPSIYKMKSLCAPNTADIPAISRLKENITQNIDEIWERNLTIWHKTALFLLPPAASMQRTDIDSIKEFCISHIKDIKNDTLTSSAQPSLSLSNNSSLKNCKPPSPASPSNESDSICSLSSSQTSANPPPSLQQDNEFFFSNLLRNSSETSNESSRDEVERYCKEIVHMTDDFNLIGWWKNNVKTYPRLSKFALQIHSVPASNAAAERTTSLAGNILNEKRNMLGPKSLDSLLFLHSFYKDFEK